jgi:anti-sigma regulatory factor (Ser/Thr protein kinase)
MATRVQHSIPHGPHAPATARRALDVLKGRLDADALAELRLLVSELVTNAVRHGRPRRDRVELQVWLDGARARVDVMDGGRGFVPPGRPPHPGEPGGWGLVVVDRLADRWGVEGNGATRVWLEFECAKARAGAAGPS